MKAYNDKPLITFGLMAYNDARFIGQALAAAFSQTYEPLEIVVSDDCSTDQTAAVIEQMAAHYRGPHAVVVNRNQQNLGLSRHINRIMELARGEMVVIAAADDVSLPHRVQRLHDAFVASGARAFSIHSSCLLINGSGETIGAAQEYDAYEADLETVVEQGTWLYGCTHAWHRAIFDRFGPLPADVTREDEVLPFRSLLLGTIAYIREPLVLYRLHEKNISMRHRRVARDRKDHHDLVCSTLQERLVNLNSFLSDLEKAAGLVAGDRRDALRERLLREIEHCEVEKTLKMGTVKEKLALLRRDAIAGFDPVLTARVLLRILLPELYAQYSYRRYKRCVTKEAEGLPDGGRVRRLVPLQQWPK